MRSKLFAVLLFSVCSLAAQTSIITINDNKGNRAVGTVTDGHVYFRDSNGNIAVGTMEGGRVYLNTSQGETIFGNLKDGNVTLTDQKGITTGFIKNGTIFLNNSGGSVTTGTYNRYGATFTDATPPPASAAQGQQDNSQLQQRIQQSNANAYAVGYNAGYGIGSGLVLGIDHHKMSKFCKANPTGIFSDKSNAYSGTLCKNAPFSASQQTQVDIYCKDHPGGEIAYGLHSVTCFTPPREPNLKWAKWEMEELHQEYEAELSMDTDSNGANQSRASWTAWKTTYCGIARAGTSYRDLDGKKQRCN